MSEKTVRCTHCEAEFTDAELEGAVACPSCKTTGVPCAIANDVTVKINWHELRILGIWADNWARHIKDVDQDAQDVVGTITARLERQHPERTKLTLFKEIKEIPQGVKVYDHGELIFDHKGGNKA